jgi:hypothetical protein
VLFRAREVRARSSKVRASARGFLASDMGISNSLGRLAEFLKLQLVAAIGVAKNSQSPGIDIRRQVFIYWCRVLSRRRHLS